MEVTKPSGLALEDEFGAPQLWLLWLLRASKGIDVCAVMRDHHEESEVALNELGFTLGPHRTAKPLQTRLDEQMGWGDIDQGLLFHALRFPPGSDLIGRRSRSSIVSRWLTRGGVEARFANSRRSFPFEPVCSRLPLFAPSMAVRGPGAE